MPVQRIIGGVQIQHDLIRRLSVGLQEQLDKQPLDRRALRLDLVIAIGDFRGMQLQAVERALARQCHTVGSMGLKLPQQRAKHRIVPQLIVIVQILVPQRDPNTRCPMSVLTVCSIRWGLR